MRSRTESLLLRLSLQHRILVFMCGIMLAVFGALGYIGWIGVSQTISDKLDERKATALVVAHHLDELVSHAQNDLEKAAADLPVGPGVETKRTSDALAQSLHQLDFFFSYLLVFDSETNLVATTHESGGVTLNGEVRKMLAEAMQQKSASVSNLVPLPIAGAYGILFVTPIVSQGAVLGVLVGEMVVPHPAVSSIASALELGATGHMEVIDEKGWVLASTYPEDIVDGTEHPDFYLPLAREKQEGLGRALHYSRPPVRTPGPEVWHVMAFAPLSKATWGVGLGQSESETFAASIDLRNRTIAVAVIALAFALCAVWIGTQSVVRPIRALTRAGERMATGDLSDPIGVVQPDEVGGLAQVLEVMRARLEQSIGEVNALNRDLEQRVRNRTRELEISNRHLSTLMNVAMEASRRLDTKELLGRALRELVENLDARSGWVLLRDGKEQRLRLTTDHGLPDSVRSTLATIEDPRATCIRSLNLPATFVEPDLSCPILPKHLPLTMNTKCWCTSVRVGSEPLGAICLAIPSERQLTTEEIALVQGVARQVAVAFENARLSEETARLEAQRHLALLRAELLATVSHELRTPLGFIKGYTTTLLRQDVAWDEEHQKEFLQVIDEECDRLAELVESLLDAARSQAGRLSLHRQPVLIEGLVQRSIERMAGMLKNHQVVYDRRASPVVLADEARLEQVVVNLLQNAAKYSPKGGVIEIRTEMLGDEARIVVMDEGVGVPLTEVSRIFEPFYRLSSGVNAAGGAGLGLAVSRAIVEAHGGRIWAEPRSERGIAIYFTIPQPDSDRGETVDGQEVRASH